MPVCKDAPREGDRRILELGLERNLEAPSLARAAIAGFCEDREYSPSTMATLTLLVSEIVTNAVIHPEVEAPAVVGLYVRLAQETVRVEVSDHGSGFIPKPRDPSQVGGGYGLYLLEKEAASWGVQEEPHTTVWFEVPARAA